MKIQRLVNVIVLIIATYFLLPSELIPTGDLLPWLLSVSWRGILIAAIAYGCAQNNLSKLGRIPRSAYNALERLCLAIHGWSCEVDLSELNAIKNTLGEAGERIYSSSCLSEASKEQYVSFINRCCKKQNTETAWMSFWETVFVSLCLYAIKSYGCVIGLVPLFLVWWIMIGSLALSPYRSQKDPINTHVKDYDSAYKWGAANFLISAIMTFWIIGDHFWGDPSGYARDSWWFNDIFTLRLTADFCINLNALAVAIIFTACIMLICYAQACTNTKRFVEALRPLLTDDYMFTQCPHCSGAMEEGKKRCEACYGTGVILCTKESPREYVEESECEEN